MDSFFSPLKSGRRWLKAVLLGLSLLLPVRGALAQIPTYYNDVYLNTYTAPIIATNFFNDTGGIFSFNNNPGAVSWIDNLYHGWRHTLNFTNFGEMDSVTGFCFDQQGDVISHSEAAGFYNAGNVNCGLGANAIFLNTGFTLVGGNAIFFGGYGGADVWATNLLNSGTIAVGYDGLARMRGDNLDFTYGTVSIQSSGSTSANTYATGQTDTDTNKWNPANLFTDFSATGEMLGPPYALSLFNSVPFVQTINRNATNVIYRFVFLQDGSGGNVSTNVYFDATQNENNGNNGGAHVEWVGTYTDPASGQPQTTYLYLDDDYNKGSATNILKYGDPGAGVPQNYTFTATTTPRSLGAPFAGGSVAGLFPSASITTNIYSYVNAQLIATTMSTNGTGVGFGSAAIAVTNLPGRIEITANKGLNLSGSAITGMNYLLLKSTNEFDTDGQTPISAPFSDVYLGHTNGSMAVANLLPASIPTWSGTVQAWTTEFSYTDTNAGINYEFRVLLVNSQVAPTTAPQQQDFVLYSSNNVVISDTLNIFRTFSLNCTNLLLTTNGVGNGFLSADGELNLNSTGINWANSVPRLSRLTNNGAIRTLNLTTYGTAATPYLTLYNSGLISNYGGVNAYARDFENYGPFSAGIGSFAVSALTATNVNGPIQAAGTFAATADSLVISGSSIQAGKSFTLTATNLLSDGGVTNGSFWSLGTGYPGYGTFAGLTLPIKPVAGDLLGTTITNVAVAGIQKDVNTWAGEDRGYSVLGFNNNAAIGQLVLDAQGSSSKFYFTGTTNANAIYVDCLRLLNFASYTNRNNTNLNALTFNTNLVIYYAQAVIADGTSVAEKINGYNTNHLRWVPGYAGNFSSVTLVYPDGTTNVVNAALAASNFIDSNGNGTVNSQDPAPIFVPSQVKFNLTTTNRPPKSARLQWATIPHATNTVYYTTNLLTPWPWPQLTNFISPQAYPGSATNVWVFDALTNGPHYYRVLVQP